MQIEKSFDMSLLLDIYGNLLTGKQRDAMDMYVNLDYSLSETAENLAVSRQAVLDLIKRSSDKLLGLEAQLGVMDKYKRTLEQADEIERLAKGAEAEGEIRQRLARLRNIWDEETQGEEHGI